ncbi:hypothetical protein A3Q56_06087 [Intoshia linei]|uniref:Uncharacterized protein n=1 Tax=Intoshia linei TaxID=1819745 RepID=A0A177AW28_9BILA|nr:hypothetical protein A3Q56_06087 [Intoshia linei]
MSNSINDVLYNLKPVQVSKSKLFCSPSFSETKTFDIMNLHLIPYSKEKDVIEKKQNLKKYMRNVILDSIFESVETKSRENDGMSNEPKLYDKNIVNKMSAVKIDEKSKFFCNDNDNENHTLRGLLNMKSPDVDSDESNAAIPPLTTFLNFINSYKYYQPSRRYGKTAFINQGTITSGTDIFEQAKVKFTQHSMSPHMRLRSGTYSAGEITLPLRKHQIKCLDNIIKTKNTTNFKPEWQNRKRKRNDDSNKLQDVCINPVKMPTIDSLVNNYNQFNMHHNMYRRSTYSHGQNFITNQLFEQNPYATQLKQDSLTGPELIHYSTLNQNNLFANHTYIFKSKESVATSNFQNSILDLSTKSRNDKTEVKTKFQQFIDSNQPSEIRKRSVSFDSKLNSNKPIKWKTQLQYRSRKDSNSNTSN